MKMFALAPFSWSHMPAGVVAAISASPASRENEWRDSCSCRLDNRHKGRIFEYDRGNLACVLADQITFVVLTRVPSPPSLEEDASAAEMILQSNKRQSNVNLDDKDRISMINSLNSSERMVKGCLVGYVVPVGSTVPHIARVWMELIADIMHVFVLQSNGFLRIFKWNPVSMRYALLSKVMLSTNYTVIHGQSSASYNTLLIVGERGTSLTWYSLTSLFNGQVDVLGRVTVNPMTDSDDIMASFTSRSCMIWSRSCSHVIVFDAEYKTLTKLPVGSVIKVIVSHPQQSFILVKSRHDDVVLDTYDPAARAVSGMCSVNVKAGSIQSMFVWRSVIGVLTGDTAVMNLYDTTDTMALPVGCAGGAVIHHERPGSGLVFYAPAQSTGHLWTMECSRIGRVFEKMMKRQGNALYERDKLVDEDVSGMATRYLARDQKVELITEKPSDRASSSHTTYVTDLCSQWHLDNLADVCRAESITRSGNSDKFEVLQQVQQLKQHLQSPAMAMLLLECSGSFYPDVHDMLSNAVSDDTYLNTKLAPVLSQLMSDVNIEVQKPSVGVQPLSAADAPEWKLEGLVLPENVDSLDVSKFEAIEVIAPGLLLERIWNILSIDEKYCMQCDPRFSMEESGIQSYPDHIISPSINLILPTDANATLISLLNITADAVTGATSGSPRVHSLGRRNAYALYTLMCRLCIRSKPKLLIGLVRYIASCYAHTMAIRKDDASNRASLYLDAAIESSALTLPFEETKDPEVLARVFAYVDLLVMCGKPIEGMRVMIVHGEYRRCISLLTLYAYNDMQHKELFDWLCCRIVERSCDTAVPQPLWNDLWSLLPDSYSVHELLSMLSGLTGTKDLFDNSENATFGQFRAALHTCMLRESEGTLTNSNINAKCSPQV